MKKVLNKLFSMKVAITLLILLIAACVAGSVITQGYSESYYLNLYSETVVKIIMGTGMNDVFHTWWFITLTVFLCISLLGCNILRFKHIYRRMNSCSLSAFPSKSDTVLTTEYDPKLLLSKLGFRNFEEAENKIYSVKNRIGFWGAWLTHIGILVIIAGFALGQLTTVKYTVYGTVGETKPVEDTNLSLTINDFSIDLREDETVVQYTSNVTVTNNDSGVSDTGDTSVNHPANLLGYKVYQNSTGWAAKVCFYEDDQPLECTKLCVGEYVNIEHLPGLTVLFRGFYPDYISVDGQPYTKTSQLNNPAYLYIVYYNGQVIGMNVLENDYISLDGPQGQNFKITFSDPESYTLLQLKKDNTTWIAMIGALILLIALYIAFYMPVQEVMAENKGGAWDIHVRSTKGNVLLKDKIHLLDKELKQEVK